MDKTLHHVSIYQSSLIRNICQESIVAQKVKIGILSLSLVYGRGAPVLWLVIFPSGRIGCSCHRLGWVHVSVIMEMKTGHSTNLQREAWIGKSVRMGRPLSLRRGGGHSCAPADPTDHARGEERVSKGLPRGQCLLSHPLRPGLQPHRNSMA